MYHYVIGLSTLFIAGLFFFFSIKIHDLNELKEVYTIVDIEEEKGAGARY